MKIISNEAGRAHQTFIADEVNPPGGYHVSDAIRLISERYRFSKIPSLEDAQSTGAIFTNGQLISGNQKINIQEIGVLKDAVFATAKDTTTAEFILDDLSTWAEQVVGWRPSITKIPRKYDNVAVVEFEANIEGCLKVFNEFISSYNGMLATLYNKTFSATLYRIDFGVESLGAKLANSDFRVERRVGMPFSSNRFHCAAPLKTEMHMELLELFERTLS